MGVMARNHRGFVEAVLAGSKVGADLVLLNTEAGAPQLAEVLDREGVDTVLHDDEFAAVIDESGFGGTRITNEQLDGLGDHADAPKPSPPSRPGRMVILTSGTTGTPKGAQRGSAGAPLDLVTTALSQVPLRAREPIAVAPPLFHGLGFGYLGFSLLMASTVVLRPRF